MINKSKIALIAALAVGVASPALAQSFNKGDGTGNSLPFAYGPGGTKPAWTVEAPQVAPQNNQVAVRQTGSNRVAVRQTGHTRFAAAGTRGLYNYVAPSYPANADPNANSPAATGGGSLGYNQMLLIY